MKKVILMSVVGFSIAFSHSGGTDAYGCHTNHKTGVYHCHKTNIDLIKGETVSKNDTTKKHIHKDHAHKDHHTKS